MASNINRRIELSGPKGTFSVVSREPPCPADNGVVIKIDYAGICHSDVHFWNNSIKVSDDQIITMDMIAAGYWDKPRVLGHEIFGRIIQFGDGVGSSSEGLTVGDRVVVFIYPSCGRCGYCNTGHSNLCDGDAVNFTADGGYQDYLALSSVKNVCKVPDSIPGQVGCLLGCSGLTAYTACKKAMASITTAVTAKGAANFLICGAGGVGQWAIGIAKVLFPPSTKIFAADASSENLNLAKSLGAEPILWPINGDDAAIIEATKSATGGIDATIDFIGSPIIIGRMFQCANKNATLVLVGFVGGTAKFSIFTSVMRSIHIVGNLVGTLPDLHEFIEFCEHHPEVKGAKITIVQPEDVGSVIKLLDEGKYAGRAVINMTRNDDVITGVKDGAAVSVR